MPNLRDALKQTSGVDTGGNEFTLEETDMQPYIDNPEMAQMEADVTKARYGGSSIQESKTSTGATAQGTAAGNQRGVVDFSRRGAFEQSVFKQLQSESMPNGNPFDFDTTAKMNEITKTDMPELFAQVFQGQVTWQDRHLLDDDQKKYWQGEVKAFRAHLKGALDSEKNEGVDMYNQMMNQFDNMAKEQESLRKRKRQKGIDVAKDKETRGKAQAANLKRRTELLTNIREMTVMIMDAKTTGTLSDAEAGAMAAELQGHRDELKVINANLRGPKKEAPKPKGDVQTASADGKESPAGEKTIVRKKVPKQGASNKTVVKTGTVKSGPNKGRKKIMYEDGSTAYADEIK